MEDQPIMQPVSPKKFPVIATVLISVVLTALIVGGGVYFWQAMQLKNVEESLQKQIDDLRAGTTQPQATTQVEVEDQIENWSLYQENASVQVGTGKCGNQEFDNFLDQANAGSRKTLNLNGLTLVVTPNYNNWSNEKFVAFNNDSTAICGAGGYYPLHAYSDKLLWRGVCGTGAAPEPEEPDYAAKMAALNLCEKTLQDVDQLFPKATTYTNQAYGFSLTFPASWGEIEEQIVDDVGIPKIVRAIRLSSETDEARHVQIHIFNLVDKTDPYVIDAPQTFIKENNQYAFYDYNPECPICDPVIQNEARQIIQTFTLTAGATSQTEQIETREGVLAAHPEDAEAAYLRQADGTTLFLVAQNETVNFSLFVGKRVRVKGTMSYPPSPAARDQSNFLVSEISAL